MRPQRGSPHRPPHRSQQRQPLPYSARPCREPGPHDDGDDDGDDNDEVHGHDHDDEAADLRDGN